MERCVTDSMMSSQSDTSPSMAPPKVTFKVIEDYVPPAMNVQAQSSDYYRYMEKSAEQIDDQIEYDMDEEDFAWLELINEKRVKEGLIPISEDLFELAMDRFEKESVFQCESSATDDGHTASVDEDAPCSVCGSGEFDAENTILFCDLCNIAVHQVCYGVPRVPAGPWACRRCTLSPSRAVDCCLCPNGSDGGAMKPTDDGRWAHVSCALWIPEVSFGCTSVREPIVGVDRVAAARWKLLCVVCRRRGGGACLQCRRTSCYTAFHVSCAIRAGLCVGVPTGEEDGAAFCDVHSSNSGVNTQQKLNAACKALSELKSMGPPLSVPVMTTAGLSKIQQKVALDKKDPFIGRLHCYWTLKRRSRNGAPLLRSMLYSFTHLARQRILMSSSEDITESQQKKETVDQPDNQDNIEEMVAHLKYWKRLRQDLEKVRLLLELVRKRERMKNEQVKIMSQQVELQLQPLVVLLSRTLDELCRLDSEDILSADRGSQVMSMSVIRDRLLQHEYSSVDEFSTDIDQLMSAIPGASAALKEKASSLVAMAKKLAVVAKYDPETGIHLSDSISEAVLGREKGQDVASKRSSSTPLSSDAVKLPQKSNTVGSAPAAVARPRGRPKKKTQDTVEQADTATPESRQATGARTASLSEPAVTKHASASEAAKPTTASARTPAGVNRRTAVLFGNKTPRRALPKVTNQPSALSPPAPDAKTPRRPGRPPKHVQHDTTEPAAAEAEKPARKCSISADPVEKERETQKTEENMDVAIPKKAKRGRKKRSTVEQSGGTFGLGSQWSESVSGGPGWGSASKTEGASAGSSSRAPQKESFRQYRVMNDSDVERSPRSEDEDDEEASSSASGTSSSHSDDDDDDDDDDNSSSSSGSHSDSAGNKHGVSSTSQNISAILSPLDLVWAKCRGFPWFPAQIVDPEMPRSGVVNRGVHIKAPSEEVLKLRQKYSIPVYLVTFFDSNRTWRWLPRNKLDPLGVDSELDRVKLTANNKPNVRSAIQRAYDKAVQQNKPADSKTSNNEADHMSTD